MTVRIAADVATRIRRTPGRVVIQIQDASDVEAAAMALEGARPEIDIIALKGARDVERIPSGPFVTVVDRDDGRGRMLAVPAVVGRHLDAAGVGGTVACIDHDGLLTSSLWGLPALGPAVICRLYPPPPEIWEDPPTGVPEGWLAETAAWLTAGLSAEHALWSEVGLVEFSLAANDAAGFLEQQRRHRRSALVVAARPRPDEAIEPSVTLADPRRLCSDEPGRPLRAAALCSGPLQAHLALGIGGPGATADLAEAFEGLMRMARSMVEKLAYAFVDISPTFLRFVGVHHPLQPFCDEAVFGGFPYQILGPGHLARLGNPPPGARPLAAGRFELSVTDLSGWITEWTSNPPIPPVRVGGMRGEPLKQLLRPCLELDGHTLRLERWDRVKRRRLDLEDLAVPEYHFDPPNR